VKRCKKLCSSFYDALLTFIFRSGPKTQWQSGFSSSNEDREIAGFSGPGGMAEPRIGAMDGRCPLDVSMGGLPVVAGVGKTAVEWEWLTMSL
jgi:hypothetical protein